MRSLYYTLGLGLSCLGLCTTNYASSDFEQSLGVGYFQLFNVKTSYGAQSASLPSLGALSNRIYLDGYNSVDSSNDVGEGGAGLASRTGNFGYQSNSQVNTSAGTLALHNYSLPSGSYFSTGNQNGKASFEVNYKLSLKSNNPFKLGLELRAADVSFNATSTSSAAANLNLVTDTYQLGGVVPPVAPYSGPYTVTAFTPRIGDTPTRSTQTVAGTDQGTRSLSLKGTLIRLGGTAKWVYEDKSSLVIHGGPASISLSGNYSLKESFSSSSISGALNVAGSGSRNKQILGYYYGATADLKVSDHWRVSAGLDFVNLGHDTLSGSTSYARVDLTQAMTVHGDLNYRF